MNDPEDDSDRLLRELEQLLEDERLDLLYRVEKLEIASGLLSEASVFKSIPPIQTQADADRQMEELNERITILEQRLED